MALAPIEYDTIATVIAKDKAFAGQDVATLTAGLKRAARHLGCDGQRLEDLTPAERPFAAILLKLGKLTAERDARTGEWEPRYAVEDKPAPTKGKGK